jgi:Peptidase inhibitor family I36
MTFSRISRRVATSAAAVALAFTGLELTAAAPAAAAADPSSCPANAVCMYEHANFEGTAVYSVLGDGFPSGVCAVINTDFDNRISSIVNNTPRNLVWYVDANCQGNSFITTPFSQTAYVGDAFNDRLTSTRL